MAIIFSLLACLLALVFLLYAERIFGIVYFRDHRPVTLLMSSFFAGLIIFALFTGSIQLIGQRVTLIIVSLLMIYANLFLSSKKKDETEKVEKEKGKKK